MKRTIIFITLIIALCSSLRIYARQSGDLRVLVERGKNENCSGEFTKSAMDMLECELSYLIKSGRQRVTLLRAFDVERGSSRDAGFDARMSISVARSESDRYMITADVYGFPQDKILYTVNSGYVRDGAREKAVAVMSAALLSYFKSAREIQLSAQEKPRAAKTDKAGGDYKARVFCSFGVCAPFGSFSDIAGAGGFAAPGCALDDIYFFAKRDVSFSLRARFSCYRFRPRGRNVKSLSLSEFSFAAGPSFKTSAAVINPYASFGFLRTTLSRNQASPVNAMERVKTKTYLDPFSSLSVEMRFEFGKFYLSAEPSINFFFERGNTGVFCGVSAGCGFNF